LSQPCRAQPHSRPVAISRLWFTERPTKQSTAGKTSTLLSGRSNITADEKMTRPAFGAEGWKQSRQANSAHAESQYHPQSKGAGARSKSAIDARLNRVFWSTIGPGIPRERNLQKKTEFLGQQSKQDCIDQKLGFSKAPTCGVQNRGTVLCAKVHETNSAVRCRSPDRQQVPDRQIGRLGRSPFGK